MVTFTHLVNRCSLSAYYVPVTLLDTEDVTVSKMNVLALVMIIF